MGTDNSFLGNASTYFDKIMKQTYVSNSEILSLKKKLKVLKESDESYKPIFNKVLHVSEKSKGKNEPSILKEAYDFFKEKQNNN